MKYSTEVTINKNINRVVELFDDPNNLGKWQPGFVSFEHFEGTFGEPGSKSKLKYKMGKREVEMIETLISRNLPHEFTGTYEMKGATNYISNRFEKIDENVTRLVSVSEFKFSALFMKLFALISPGSFKKQSQIYLDNFKKFVEEEG